MWLRVFGTNDLEPQPAALLEYLAGLDGGWSGNFRGDEQGWFNAELFHQGRVVWQVERYLAREEGIRAELNSWAAWLETAEANPHHDWLMELVINTRQLFTLRSSVGQEAPEAVAWTGTELCRYLARSTAGVYQVDGVGFSAADGAVLVSE
jgi:hypothetical protein